MKRRARQVERDVVEHGGEDEEGEEADGEHAQQFLSREQREKAGRVVIGAGVRRLARQPAQRRDHGARYHRRRRDECQPPMSGREYESAEETPAHASRNGRRDVPAHDQVESLRRQRARQVRRQARAHRRDEEALQEAGSDQDADVRRQRAGDAGGRHHRSTAQDDGADGNPVGEHAKGKVGERDAEDDRGDGEGGDARRDAELGRQHGQDRLRDVHREEGGGDEREHHRLHSAFAVRGSHGGRNLSRTAVGAKIQVQRTAYCASAPESSNRICSGWPRGTRLRDSRGDRSLPSRPEACRESRIRATGSRAHLRARLPPDGAAKRACVRREAARGSRPRGRGRMRCRRRTPRGP